MESAPDQTTATPLKPNGSRPTQPDSIKATISRTGSGNGHDPHGLTESGHQSNEPANTISQQITSSKGLGLPVFHLV